MQHYSRVRIFLLIAFLLVSCDIALSVAPADAVRPSSWLVYLVNVPRGVLPGVALALLVFAFGRVNHLEWRSHEKQRHLEESERQLRTITSSARDAIIMVDSEGRISFWNEAASRMFGYSSVAVLGRGVHELLAPSRYHDAFRRALPTFRATGTGGAVNKTLDLEAIRAGGEVFPVELSLSAVRLRDQWYGVAVVRDVTQRRRAEETLRFRLEAEKVVNEVFGRLMVMTTRGSSEVYQDALAVLGRFVEADEGSIFVLADEGHRLVSCCRWRAKTADAADPLELCCASAPWWFGELGRGEVVRISNVEALPQSAKDELAALGSPSTGSLLAAPLVFGGGTQGFVLLHWPNAVTTWREEHIALVKTAAFVFTGTIVRVQATEASQAAHAELTQVFNAAVPLCVISRKLTILRVNDSFCSFFGTTREDLVGRACHDVWSTSSCIGLESVIRQIREGQSWVEYEEDRALPDGRTVSCFITATPYRGKDDELVGIVTSYTDITDRKQAEQETRDYAMALESANQALEQFNEIANAATRAKSDFLANMSHEIRTPMTAILGFAEVLRDPRLSDDEREAAVDTILRNGQHLLQLINDILDLSKIESGRMVLEEISCWPIEIAHDVVSLMSLRAAAKGLSLVLKFDGAMPEMIHGDPTRLRQVLINLVANAVKFTEAGGVRVVVRMVEQGTQPWLQWDVVDSGIGMAAEQIARVFEPFTQADETVTRKYGGTGLGLAISWRMAQAMGGTITVESTPKHGSMFRLAVPVKLPKDVVMIERPAEWRAGSLRDGQSPPDDMKLRGRVLLAEDGPDNQTLITFLLRKAGAEVEVAENGLLACEKALAAVRAGRAFDAILMDMQMPEMDGYAATARLRREGVTQPIIALTAHAMADDREKCIAAGCDDFATKPIQRADLLALVARFLHTARPVATASRS